MKQKKAASFSTITQVLLALVVLLIILFAVSPPLRDVAKKIMNLTQKDLDPSELQRMEDEKENVLTSMTALIEAINDAASGEVSYSEKNKLDEDSFNNAPQSYRITFFGTLEALEDDNGMGFERPYSISRTFSLEDESYFFEEKSICADLPLSEATFRTYTKFFSDYSSYYGVSPDFVPMKQIKEINNLKLETFDESGNVICSISTSKDSDFFSGNDLGTWGLWNFGCDSISGCDKNNNGIPGSFQTSDIGRKAYDVYGKENYEEMEEKWELMESSDFSSRFSYGYITKDSAEECMDSPTWLECPGIKVHYCGKTGFKTAQSRQASFKDYFIKRDNEIHSRASIRVLRVFNQSFDGEKNTYKNYFDNSGLVSIESDKGIASVKRDRTLEFFYDALKKIGSFFSGAAGTKMDDSRVSCLGGEEYGNSSVMKKCNEFGCNVCNFNLPQDMEGMSAQEWIVGNGDPRYIVYYEGFPLGEEEAWILDWQSTSLATLALWNIGMPAAGKILRSIKSVPSRLSNLMLTSEEKKLLAKQH
jgi:hypothetical protein